MSKIQIALSVVGVMLMSYFGSRIGNATAAGSESMAAFSLGLILVCQAPAIGLLARVKRLEAELASTRGDVERAEA